MEECLLMNILIFFRPGVRTERGRGEGVSQIQTAGAGEGSKITKNVRTSSMDGPVFHNRRLRDCNALIYLRIKNALVRLNSNLTFNLVKK